MIKNTQTTNLNSIRAVVFDMDGVIFDSERIVLECWEEIAKTYQIKDIQSILKKCLGVNSEGTKQIFLSHYGTDFPYDQYKQLSSKMFHEQYDGGRLPMKPGVVEILSFLKEKGYFIALASSTRTAVVRQELEDAGILSYFDQVICGDMVEKSKPEPDIFLAACKALSVNPKEAIAVEDSFNGIRSAYLAGMCAVMIPDQMMPDAEMQKLTDAIFNDLNEFKQFLS